LLGQLLISFSSCTPPLLSPPMMVEAMTATLAVLTITRFGGKFRKFILERNIYIL
jgi:hypothetical protein